MLDEEELNPDENQGTEIHCRPGEEKHLPKEAWHVIPNRRGGARPEDEEDEEKDE